jgi:hypothetical protein
MEGCSGYYKYGGEKVDVVNFEVDRLGMSSDINTIRQCIKMFDIDINSVCQYRMTLLLKTSMAIRE